MNTYEITFFGKHYTVYSTMEIHADSMSLADETADDMADALNECGIEIWAVATKRIA